MKYFSVSDEIIERPVFADHSGYQYVHPAFFINRSAVGFRARWLAHPLMLGGPLPAILLFISAVY
jgi:hypothetical protein